MSSLYTFSVTDGLIAFDVEADSPKEAVEIANRDFSGYHDLWSAVTRQEIRVRIPALRETDIHEVVDLEEEAAHV